MFHKYAKLNKCDFSGCWFVVIFLLSFAYPFPQFFASVIYLIMIQPYS